MPEILSREEQAEKEIGVTEISRSAAAILMGVFLLTVGFVPLAQHIHELRLPGEDRGLPQCYDMLRMLPSLGEVGSIRSIRDLLNALPSLKEIDEYEDALEEQSVVANWILPKVQLRLTGWLGAGNEQALAGRDGWLFYRPGVEYLTQPGFLEEEVLARRSLSSDAVASPQPDPLKAIIHFKEQLAERGIDLLLMPTPTKAIVHPEKLVGTLDSDLPQQNVSWETFITQLRDSGAEVFDPTPLLIRKRDEEKVACFLETDTHWSPGAMDFIASELAGLIEKNSKLAALDSLDFQRQEMSAAAHGDIAVMLKLPESQALYSRQEVTIQQVQDVHGKDWAPDPKAEVLLLGDSFSNIYSLEAMGWGKSAGFAEQLSYHLRRPLDRIVINAGGAYTTRQQLRNELLRGQDRLSNKKLVIYQFAMRELSLGDWKLLKLPDVKARKESPKVRPTTPELVVTGSLQSRTSAPVPKSVPYKDCLIAAHLTDIEVSQGELDEEEIQVFVWGMRENKWTSAMKWKTDQKLSLQLTPWHKVAKKYGSFNRVELDDEELILLDVYWGVETNGGQKGLQRIKGNNE
jgi:alginate O-acetyltransferase complex protein AlgJ